LLNRLHVTTGHDQTPIMNACTYNVALDLMDYTGYDAKRSGGLCEGLEKQEYIESCRDQIPGIIIAQAPSNVGAGKYLDIFRSKCLNPKDCEQHEKGYFSSALFTGCPKRFCFPIRTAVLFVR